MAIKYAPRVKETTLTVGDETAAHVLGGAAVGFQTFANAGFIDGNFTTYCCTNGVDWEIAVGEFSESGNSLSREFVTASSNAGSAVNWAAGSKEIFCIFPDQLLSVIKGGSDGAFGGMDANDVAGGMWVLCIGAQNQVTDPASTTMVALGYNHDLQTELHQVFSFGVDIRARHGKGVLFSNGGAAETGDTQHSLSNLSVETTDATETGVTDTSLVPFSGYDATVAYVVDVVARQTGGTGGTVGDSKWIRLEFLVKYATTPALTLVGSVTTTTLAASAGASAWTAALDVAEAACIRVTGEADKTIRWVASIKGIELGLGIELPA